MKKTIVDNFIIGIILVCGACFLAFQGYLFFSTAQMFIIDASSMIYFALTFLFNFTTTGLLLFHTKNEKTFVEVVERIILPRYIFKPFYFLAIMSNMMTLVELNQAITGITSYNMGNSFWLGMFFISFGISNVAMIFFKFLLMSVKKEEKIKTPLGSVFIETDQ